MNKDEVRKQRRTLSVLFSVVLFIALFLSMVIVVALAFTLLWNNALPPGYNSIEGVYLLVAAILLTSMIVGSGISSAAIRLLLVPVNRLVRGLDRLASGKYKTRLRPRHHFERRLYRLKVMQDAADSFNTLAEELENTELLRMDFINNFSHEFKTPIVSIAGFAKLLKRGNLTEEQKMEYLDIIEEESLRLSAMATNVLELTRVENQRILTDVSDFNLSEQLRTCVLILEAKWERKHLDMQLDFDEIGISGSEELLKQVWINLLDNAVKFAPEGAAVRVTAEETAEGVTVSVENEGPEIPAEAQKKVFKKFYQADESHAAEGNGIGLAIAKRVTELHGGEVSVASGDGRTVFTVRLPAGEKRGARR